MKRWDRVVLVALVAVITGLVVCIPMAFYFEVTESAICHRHGYPKRLVSVIGTQCVRLENGTEVMRPPSELQK